MRAEFLIQPHPLHSLLTRSSTHPHTSVDEINETSPGLLHNVHFYAGVARNTDHLSRCGVVTARVVVAIRYVLVSACEWAHISVCSFSDVVCESEWKSRCVWEFIRMIPLLCARERWCVSACGTVSTWQWLCDCLGERVVMLECVCMGESSEVWGWYMFILTDCSYSLLLLCLLYWTVSFPRLFSFLFFPLLLLAIRSNCSCWIILISSYFHLVFFFFCRPAVAAENPEENLVHKKSNVITSMKNNQHKQKLCLST